MIGDIREIYFWLVRNNFKKVDWRKFKSTKTPFGLHVDTNRTDVLVCMLIENGNQSEDMSQYGEEFAMIDKPSSKLSLIITVPEESRNYGLYMWRENAVPVLKRVNDKIG